MLVASVTQAMPTPFPGPNAFGYVGSDIPLNVRNLLSSGDGTALNLADDELSGPIDLGFTFDFFGNSYSSLNVGSNGFVQFDGTPGTGFGNPVTGCCTGQVLGDGTGLGNLIAGMWEDLNPTQGGDILYRTSGSEFVLGFYAVPHFFASEPVTFEIVLNGASNDIELHYDSLQSDGGTHTLGITNIGDTDDLTLYRGTDISQFADEGFLISAPSSGQPIPEPSALALFGLGIFSLAFLRRRTKV